MTGQTKKLIESFAFSKDTKLLPSIILSLQEEDGLADKLRFRNCFKMLRNIAAHEPAVLTTQIVGKDNVGHRKLSFVTAEEIPVILDTVQLTLWMFDMFLQTKEEGYLVFILGFVQAYYEKGLRFYIQSGRQYQFGEVNSASRLLDEYLDWCSYLWDQYGITQSFSVKDRYIINIYRDNRKLFWRLAVPDFMRVMLFFMSGKVNLYNARNLMFYMRLYCEMEGVEFK